MAPSAMEANSWSKECVRDSEPGSAGGHGREVIWQARRWTDLLTGVDPLRCSAAVRPGWAKTARSSWWVVDLRCIWVSNSRVVQAVLAMPFRSSSVGRSGILAPMSGGSGWGVGVRG